MRAGLAGFNATTGALTSLTAGVGGDQPLVATLELSGSTLYVGGSFDQLGGATRKNIGAIDLASGQATTWDPRADRHAVLEAEEARCQRFRLGGNRRSRWRRRRRVDGTVGR